MRPDLTPGLPGRDLQEGPLLSGSQRRVAVRFVVGITLATALVVGPVWLWAGPFPMGGTILASLGVALFWSGLFLVLRALKVVAMASVRRWRATRLLAVAAAGVVLAAGLHVAWLAWGWSDFHPRCVLGDTLFSSATRIELLGPLRPAAADAFEAAYESVWGEGAVRRTGPGTVALRPALGLVATDFLEAMSEHVAGDMRARVDVPPGTPHCTAMAIALMAEAGHARRSSGWSVWPYDRLDPHEGLGRWLIRQSSAQ